MGLYRTEARVVLFLCLCLTDVHPSSASDTVRTFYDTLNVEPTASNSQIKKSFRRLAVKFHPDKNKSEQAERTFREITEAYSVLSDEKKRRLYDSVGHKAYLQTDSSSDPDDGPETSFHFSFSDFFQDFHEDMFADEAHFHWSFLQEEEGERHSSEGPNLSFYFEGTDENEEEYHHYYYY